MATMSSAVSDTLNLLSGFWSQYNEPIILYIEFMFVKPSLNRKPGISALRGFSIHIQIILNLVGFIILFY